MPSLIISLVPLRSCHNAKYWNRKIYSFPKTLRIGVVSQLAVLTLKGSHFQEAKVALWQIRLPQDYPLAIHSWDTLYPRHPWIRQKSVFHEFSGMRVCNYKVPLLGDAWRFLTLVGLNAASSCDLGPTSVSLTSLGCPRFHQLLPQKLISFCLECPFLHLLTLHMQSLEIHQVLHV